MAPSRSLEELVERQARRWELESSSRPQAVPPCVALSRLPHAGAAELGQRVADKLDFGFFGIELVEQIARERGIQRALALGLDERVRSVIERYVADAFRTRAFNESEYLEHLVRVIATIGERGRAVILGRGAPYILKPERTLRVLVTAPTPARIERLRRESGLSQREAEHELGRIDAERRRFLTHHFRVDPDSPVLYDIVVNTATLGIDVAAVTVVEVLRRRFGPWAA